MAVRHVPVVREAAPVWGGAAVPVAVVVVDAVVAVVDGGGK